MVSMPVVLIETENENDSANQNYVKTTQVYWDQIQFKATLD